MVFKNNMAGQIKEAIRGLCFSHGWAYGLVWRIRSRDAMMLVPEDEYHEEEADMVIEKMLHQVHVVGEGVIGHVAFSGKHRWIFSENYCGDPASLNDNQDSFQDPAEWDNQFLAGIKTIALIPLSSQNVLQFGSHEKILEDLEFVDDTKSLFRRLESSPESFLFGSLQEDNGRFIGPRETMPSGAFMLGPSSPKLHLYGFSHDASSSPSPSDSSSPTATTSEWGSVIPTLAPLEQQLLSNMLMHGSASALFSTCSNGDQPYQDTVTSTQEYSDASSESLETGADFDSPAYGAGSNTGPIDSSLMFSSNEGLDSSLMFSSNEGQVLSRNLYATGSRFGSGTLLGSSIFPMVQSGFEPLNDSLCFPNLAANTRFPWTNGSLPPRRDDHGLDVPFFAPDLAGRNAISAPIGHDFRLSALRRTESSPAVIRDGNDGPMNAPPWRYSGEDLFDVLGDIESPESCDRSLNLNFSSSDYISNLDGKYNDGSRRGFFAEFGLEQLLSFGGGVSTASNDTDNWSSSSTLPRASSALDYNNQQRLSGPALSRSTSSLPSQNTGMTPRVPLMDVNAASPRSPWITRRNNSIGESNNNVEPKRSEGPARVPKRARPRESTRPRPNDRQQIQDRVKELRELVPNGEKCSIDSLLDRTTKYMRFLQSVVKYADTFEQDDGPKTIDRGDGFVLKDYNDDGDGCTWAFEVAGKAMVCPVMVQNKNPTGQMLVEMICEEHGLFLEIADMIRDCGLIILKGVMETRDDKLWARFVVEASKDVTRMEIFLSLIQLLQQTSTSSITTASKSPKMSDHGSPGIVIRTS